MASKFNLSVNDREVTAYVELLPIGRDGTCVYCGSKEANEVEVTIDELQVERKGNITNIDLNSFFGRRVIVAVKNKILHGTPVCSDCYEKYFEVLDEM